MLRHPYVAPTPARLPAGRLASALLATVLVTGAVPSTARADEVGPIPAVSGTPEDPVLARLAELRARLISRLGEPGAAADLIDLHELAPRLGRLERLVDALSVAAWSRRADPEVRALARWLLADVERRRGRLPRAEARLAELGMIRDVAFVGPFDNENKSGFDVAYGPETDLDLGKTYEGLRAEVRWRTVPDLGATGPILLGEAVRPGRHVVVYALAVLRSPVATRATLHLGASGATKVWLDGRPVLVDPGYHPARFDQHAVPVELRRGDNVLLVKLAAAEHAPLALVLRATDRDGDPIRGLVAIAPKEGSFAAPRPAPAGKAPREEGLVAALRAAAERKGSARDRYDLARVLGARRAFDAASKLHDRAAARAADLAPGDVDAQLLAAAYEDDDANVRRTRLEAAVAAERPGEARAHAALATFWLDRGFPRRALDVLDEGLGRAPADADAWLVKARALDALGLGGRARGLAAELAHRHPENPRVRKELARYLRRDGDVEGALREIRVVLGLHPSDADANGQLVSLLADRGEIDEALHALENAARFEPADPALLARRADLLAANGKPTEARALFARAVSICPQEADLHERMGRAALRAGDRTAALAAFDRGLAAEPQRASLRELVRSLQPGTTAFARPFLRDLVALAAEAKGKYEGEDAATLVDLTAVKVLPSGQSSRTRQIVRMVLTQRGVDGSRFSIRYAPDREEVRVERARVLKPDGTVVDSHAEDDRSMNEPWSGLYYDARARVIAFPGLSPGDVVEVVWRVDDVARDNLLSDYFGDVTFVQDRLPRAHWEYVLEMPAGRRIHANAVPGAEHVETRAPSGGTLHRWTARDVAKVVAEPDMPGWVEAATYLHVSTYRDWESVARFWWGLVKDQVRPTPAIERLASEIVAGIPADDEAARVRAVYDWVVTKTRYVGLEFGIHSFKPYPVERILGRKFGDCKDKASLIHSLLETLGIESRLVLLRMRNLGRIGEEPASLAVFNHAVLYVPSLDLYLDGTAEWSGSRELPGADRGAEVLIVNPEGRSEFRVTPEARAADNATVSSYRVTLGADGAAVIDGDSKVTGLAAPGYRRAYAAPSGRKAAFEQAWSRTFPGLTVDRIDVSDPTDIERDVELRYRLQVPRYAEAANGGLSFTPFGSAAAYVQTYAPLSSRKFDLVLDNAWTTRFRHEVTLPPGHAPAGLPKAVVEEGPFGSLRVTYAFEDGKLVAEGHVILSTPRIAPSDYPAFRAFLARVDGALARRVTVSSATATR